MIAASCTGSTIFANADNVPLGKGQLFGQ
jgi:hypothetical protein